MAQRFNNTQLAVIDQDARAMKDAGYSLGGVLNDLFNRITLGAIGIRASAVDVDSLALGGGHFTRDLDTADGSSLLFAWDAGRFHNGLATVSVSADSITLSPSATNYIEVDRSGTVTVNTSGFTSGKLPLWKVITGVST